MSYTVAQRHREIGLRVAFGATYARLVSLMLALVPALRSFRVDPAVALRNV